MTLQAGQVIHNRYRIAGLLGQGGMSEVYRAWDMHLKITVALKENLEASSAAQEQFSEEARLLAHLSHPNLPRVTDYFAIPNQGEYLVMDYIEGDDLELLLEQTATNQASPTGPGLEEKIVLPWLIQVCDALDYLHSQPHPIIHRDIKPGNIKITPAGRAVLVDFGIAKRYNQGRSTYLGARAVTPGYSPPEQYGGAATDARSDLYALGATLYHLLTGQEPPESVQRVAGSASPLAPRTINPAISLLSEQVILKAMAVAMDRRYQSAGEIKEALAAALKALLSTNAAPGTAKASAGAAFPAAAASANSAASSQIKPRLVTPVEPLPRRVATAPPPPQGFLATNWPLLLIGGVVLVVLVLTLARLALKPGAGSQPEAGAAQASQVAPRPTPTSAIDVLVARQAATQTAEASQAGTFVPLTPAATPAIPLYERLFVDNFRDNQNKWFTGIKDSLACWIVAGRYTCQVQQGQAANHFQWLEIEQIPSEFTLAADIWPGAEQPRGQGNANAGLVFRSSEQGRYLFSVRNDGAFRVSSIQSSPANWVDILPWQPSPVIRRGQDNRLLVAGRGSQYDLFINGQYVASFADSLWTDGYPGLHLFTAPSESAAVVEFDNFELRAAP